MERAAADFALSPSNFKEGLNITPPPIPIRLPSVEVTNDKIQIKTLEGMEIEIVFYEGRAVGIELPNTVDREVVYTEPGLRGDTTGRALKSAKLATGFEIMVPLFINQNEIIKIDTRTDEYLERVNK